MYNKSLIARLLSCDDKQPKLYGARVQLERACDPSEVVYENHKLKSGDRLQRGLLSFLAGIALIYISVSFANVGVSDDVEHMDLTHLYVTSSMHSLIASLLNLGIVFTLHAIAKFEGHLTVTDTETSSIFKISLLQFINLCMATLSHGWFNRMSWYTWGSVLAAFIPITNCLTTLFSKLLLSNGLAWLKSARALKKATTAEEKAAAALLGIPKFKLSDMYSFIYVLYWYTCTFQLVVPLVAPIAFVSFLLYCAADRFNRM